ncbi:DUF397 domain-containing protein [Saccharopolyspora shandongensis]|uniref:DUF397 domain-containing protein n=1 Tax=Saccharopolyspora shandongensis TaxID=418495 RepID=UPI0033F62596
MEIWRKSSYSGPSNNCVEVGWRKSSFSGAQTECVEVGWRKSTHSQGQDTCVEVGLGVDAVGVRDTKDRDGGHLAVPVQGWHRFIGAVKGGVFDR